MIKFFNTKNQFSRLMIDRLNINYFNEHWLIDLFLSEWLMAWWIHELGCKWQNAEIDGLDNWLIDQVMNC